MHSAVILVGYIALFWSYAPVGGINVSARSAAAGVRICVTLRPWFRCSFASDAMLAMAKISRRVLGSMSIFARNLKAALHYESRCTIRWRDRVRMRALDRP